MIGEFTIISVSNAIVHPYRYEFGLLSIQILQVAICISFTPYRTRQVVNRMEYLKARVNSAWKEHGIQIRATIMNSYQICHRHLFGIDNIFLLLRLVKRDLVQV